MVRRETISGYLFLLPSLVFFIGFVIIPMVTCVWTSFTNATMGKDVKEQFIFFDNYVRLLQDEIFTRALWNTVIIVLVSVSIRLRRKGSLKN